MDCGITAGEFCVRCGMSFPLEQVCEQCHTDAERVRSAAAVLRRRLKGRKPFVASVIVRALERWADIEDARSRD